MNQFRCEYRGEKRSNKKILAYRLNLNWHYFLCIIDFWTRYYTYIHTTCTCTYIQRYTNRHELNYCTWRSCATHIHTSKPCLAQIPFVGIPIQSWIAALFLDENKMGKFELFFWERLHTCVYTTHIHTHTYAHRFSIQMHFCLAHTFHFWFSFFKQNRRVTFYLWSQMAACSHMQYISNYIYILYDTIYEIYENAVALA